MLTITGPAVEAIRLLTSKPGLAENSGLRIAHQDTAGSLELRIKPGPDAGDEVIEAEGARVFVEPTAAAMLGSRTLSAEIMADDVIFRLEGPAPAPVTGT